MFIQSGEWVIILRIKKLGNRMKSMRFYLFLLLVVIGILPAFIIKETAMCSLEGRLVSQRTAELKQRSSILAEQLGGDPSLQMALDNSETLSNELEWLTEMYNGRLLLVDDAYRIILDTYALDEGKTCISDEVFRGFRGESYSKYDKEKNSIEFTTAIANKNDAGTVITGIMIISASAESVKTVVGDMEDKAVILEVISILLIAVLAYLLSGLFTRPMKHLASEIDKIQEGNLEVDLSANGGYLEVTQIANSISKVLKRLQALDQSRQEFVSNVSHELKTPITSIRVLADSLMCQENAPVELYREFMGDISDEIDRESKIINDLLELVRLDKSATKLHIEQVSINDLVEAILKRLRPIAKQRSIDIIFESFRPVTAEVDETKLSLAINNLVENAVKYNNDEGWVRVSLDADHKYFFLKVADSGVGIPEELTEHIFERFYRVDKARSRETGGTGLGLAITKSVIQLHHGAIKVDTKLGEGTVFTVRIPLTYLA